MKPEYGSPGYKIHDYACGEVYTSTGCVLPAAHYSPHELSAAPRPFSRYVEVYRGPDDLGRYLFYFSWLADYHPGHPDGEHRTAWRGQFYFARLPLGVEEVDLR